MDYFNLNYGQNILSKKDYDRGNSMGRRGISSNAASIKSLKLDLSSDQKIAGNSPSDNEGAKIDPILK